jgi:hypothetical protein
MGPSFERLGALLADEGRVIIGDFFRKDAARDGGAGDGVLRGGHGLEKFYRLAATQPFRIVLDEDQTPAASGTLALFEQVASERVIPFLQATGAFLRKRYPLRGRLLSWLVRQPLRRAEQRYLGGHYNQATFEKYKSYRLIVLQKVVA